MAPPETTPPEHASREPTRRELVRTELDSPVGPLIAGATDRGVCLLEFASRSALPTEGQDLERSFDRPLIRGTNEHLDHLESELGAYFKGDLQSFTVPLDLPATPFQRLVWDELLRIPYGSTTSYEAIARGVDRPGAQRAVGRANGQNRVAIVVPCHRVIEKTGGLRGYGGGLDRKRFLLELEGAIQPALFTPHTPTE